MWIFNLEILVFQPLIVKTSKSRNCVKTRILDLIYEQWDNLLQ